MVYTVGSQSALKCFSCFLKESSNIFGLCILCNMCTVSFSFITSVWSVLHYSLKLQRCRDNLMIWLINLLITVTSLVLQPLIEYEILWILEYKGDINETDMNESPSYDLINTIYNSNDTYTIDFVSSDPVLLTHTNTDGLRG
ncbi:hypothetical protein Avbf_01805 [Armadillidium vulgare]|nr:hypothetical protein Avbf_01805 [Armadillidium vulgare]